MAPKPSATRRAREIERTRQDIVLAAARVFAEAGYHQATMAAIAREAGFTAASLYTYFASKEELYEALLEDMKRALLATFLEHVPAGLTLAQRLELLLQRQLSLVAERRDALRVAFDVGPRKARPGEGAAEFLEPMTAFLSASGAADQLRCPPAEAALFLFGLVHAAVLPWFCEGAEPDVPGLASRVVDLFLNGFGKAHR
jgi:AcrR family transcriptional regulator